MGKLDNPVLTSPPSPPSHPTCEWAGSAKLLVSKTAVYFAARRGARLSRVTFAAASASLITLLACSPVGASSKLGRESADRPDELLGPQIHVIYAVPADGPDHHFDTDGTIAGSIARWQAWFLSQTGTQLRTDSAQSEPDISFIRLQENSAWIDVHNPYDLITAELQRNGFTDPTKVYAVYYDGGAGPGTSGPCGYGQPPTALIFLRVCNWSQAMIRPDAIDLDMLHEILHALGFVPACAPHHAPGDHVDDDNRDIMYLGAAPRDWANLAIDPGHDDYWEANIPGCLDLANSDFLISHRFFRLTTTVVGAGSVLLSQHDDCSGQCAYVIRDGTAINLTARPEAAFYFAGWNNNGCQMRLTCHIMLRADTAISALFKRRPHLTISIVGHGIITETPDRRRCARTCSITITPGLITLTAIPNRGFKFDGWQRPSCSMTKTCRLRLRQDARITVRFRRT
jgi:hypothetical protein